eukprot:12906514-Prorocentrum_lima.AAC.1
MLCICLCEACHQCTCQVCEVLLMTDVWSTTCGGFGCRLRAAFLSAWARRRRRPRKVLVASRVPPAAYFRERGTFWE